MSSMVDKVVIVVTVTPAMIMMSETRVAIEPETQ